MKCLIPAIVGFDRNAAKLAFAHYLECSTMSANQIRFVETIIDYLTQNGIMDLGMLYEPPFTDFHHEGLNEVFNNDEADNRVAIIHTFKRTVDARYGVA